MLTKRYFPTVLLCLLITLQPIVGFFLQPAAIYSGIVRAQIFVHLTVQPLSNDPPLSMLMGPALGLLIIICGCIGSIQWTWKKKTHLLRALVIVSFIWILLRIGLYILLIFSGQDIQPLVIGTIGLLGWGYWLYKSGNLLFQIKKTK
jgi:hypothetical protein